MKTIFKYIFLGILVGSLLFPILSVTATTEPEEEEHRFRLGSTTSVGNEWDIPVASAGTAIGVLFTGACIEPLFGVNDYYDRGLSEGIDKSEQYVPILATNWTVDFWPEEMNSLGWKNRGGVANMTLTLRENVTFHDGSPWNATVAKWNIDRCYLISGNLTGRGDMKNKDGYWEPANDWLDYYTESWNMTSYGDGLWDYGTYDGWANPNPFGGFDAQGHPIHYACYQRYPLIKRVVIVDNKTSGGTIRIEWNDFNTMGNSGMFSIRFISMKSYHDYWDRAIYGYDNENPHDLIGTGPYIYQDFDDTGSPGGGHLVKNYNYWNRTALEADGWFSADYVDVSTWPMDTLGIEARNTALFTKSLDFALDGYWTPLDTADVAATKNLNYIERPVADQVGMIVLNCINETWWSWPGYRDLTEVYYPTNYPSGNVPNGMPRALRKAVSYCFDYETYIDVGLEGKAVRGAGLGVNNIYYNPDIPLAYYNVTIARNALLNDPYFAPLCAANSLTASSTDLEWQNVANSVGGKTPLWVLDFYWDEAYQTFKNLFQTCLENIGVTLKDPTGATNKVPVMWAEIQTYWVAPCFPLFSCQGWPLEINMPSKYIETVLEYYFSDPNDGMWRPENGYQIPTDWFPWWNMAFTYNTTVDAWLKQMWLTNDTAKQDVMDNIARFAQDYQFAHMYVAQHNVGFVHWANWKVSSYWGALTYERVGYVGWPPEGIPGYLPSIFISTSVFAMLGLIYVIRRKIRFQK